LRGAGPDAIPGRAPADARVHHRPRRRSRIAGLAAQGCVKVGQPAVVPEMIATPLTGALAVAAGWLAIALLSLAPAGDAFFTRRVAFPLGALGGLALVGFGLQALWVPPEQLTLPLGLPDLPFHLRSDGLAGFFLLLLGSVSAGITLYAAGFFRAETASRLTLITLQ